MDKQKALSLKVVKFLDDPHIAEIYKKLPS